MASPYTPPFGDKISDHPTKQQMLLLVCRDRQLPTIPDKWRTHSVSIKVNKTDLLRREFLTNLQSLQSEASTIFFICTRCICFAFVYHTNTKPDTSCNLWSRLDHHNGCIVWPRCGSISVQCLLQDHNDAVPSSGTAPRVDNLSIDNLRSYPSSVAAASWDGSVKCIFRDSTGSFQELATLRLLFGALTDYAIV